MNDILEFRCQFLISRTPIEIFPSWKLLPLRHLRLYTHPDLEINWLEDTDKTIAILGDIYNPAEPLKGNVEILRDIMATTSSPEALISKIKAYGGCFAIVFINRTSSVALHDARGLREIYYCTNKNRIVCGSQPHLLAEFSSPAIKLSEDLDLINFYQNYLWDSRWVGDETCFMEVKHLLPNHYVDMDKMEACRYWPCAPIPRLSLEEAVSRSSEFLRGMIKAIIYRHPVMMGVTAGTDSRVLLAASRGLLDKIYFFINNRDLGYTNPDIVIPREIFARLSVPFHVHDIVGEVDGRFRELFFRNTYLAEERLLPSIYDLWARNHREIVLVLGVSEIGRTFYGKAPRKLSPYRMAYKLGYGQSHYAQKQCEKAIPELRSAAEKHDVNVMALIYWEQRLGNWGATRNSESLLAVEKIDPFNSHLLYEIFLGVDEKYRNYQHTPARFFGELIRYMWPELLRWPINPPYSFEDKIKGYLIRFGLYELFSELRFQVNILKYSVRSKREYQHTKRPTI